MLSLSYESFPISFLLGELKGDACMHGEIKILLTHDLNDNGPFLGNLTLQIASSWTTRQELRTVIQETAMWVHISNAGPKVAPEIRQDAV